MRRAFEFQRKIENILDITKNSTDDEIKAYLSKLLCVMVSGYLEVNLKELILEYVSNKSAPLIQAYIESSIKNLTNLKANRIIENLNKFNTDWGKDFENKITDEQKDAIDTLIANRNLISHGNDVGISYIKINEYFQKSKEIVVLMEAIIK